MTDTLPSTKKIQSNPEKYQGYDWTMNCESCIHHGYDHFPEFKSHVIHCKILAGRICGGRVGAYPKFEAIQFIKEEEMIV